MSVCTAFMYVFELIQTGIHMNKRLKSVIYFISTLRKLKSFFPLFLIPVEFLDNKIIISLAMCFLSRLNSRPPPFFSASSGPKDPQLSILNALAEFFYICFNLYI